MMNLQTSIDNRLWEVIENQYENRDFTGAILDAIHYLTDLIREKSGLDGDGAALVGQAFNVKAPKIRVNKLQTESERNVQQGLEQMLRGFYQCFRNPRSHEKLSDDQSDADAIILFVNHIVKIIDKSKASFSLTAFIKRVFDEDFVENDRYAELLVAEIPQKHRSAVFVDAYRHKTDGDGKKLKFFFKALWKELSTDEHQQIAAIISDELKITDEDAAIRAMLQCMPDDSWKLIDETARLRFENKIIKSIESGQVIKGKCTKGALATWARQMMSSFVLKQSLLNVIEFKLIFDDREIDYILQFFFAWLPKLSEQPSDGLTNTIFDALKSGDKRFYDAMKRLFTTSQVSKEWVEPFVLQMQFFAEKPRISTGDDIPF